MILWMPHPSGNSVAGYVCDAIVYIIFYHSDKQKASVRTSLGIDGRFFEGHNAIEQAKKACSADLRDWFQAKLKEEEDSKGGGMWSQYYKGKSK